MPKKRTQNQRGKQQRAMQKRSRRKTKLTRRAVHEAATERPERVLRRAREFPFAGCWVQQGWQDYGIASLVVARTQSDDDLVFGRFLIGANSEDLDGKSILAERFDSWDWLSGQQAITYSDSESVPSDDGSNDEANDVREQLNLGNLEMEYRSQDLLELSVIVGEGPSFD